MKKQSLFLLSFLLIAYLSNAQNSSFRINGQLDKVKSGIIYLNIYEGDKAVTDSTMIKNGNFKFKGSVTEPFFATLTMLSKPGDYFTFYVEPSTMSISGSGDSLNLLEVNGSVINDDDKIFKEKMKDITAWEETDSKIYEKAAKEKNKQVMDSLDQVDFDILNEKRKVVAAFVKDHPQSMRSAVAIAENYAYYAEATDVEPLYNLLDEKVKSSPKGIEIKKMIATYSSVAVGKMAPEITQTTTNGKTMSLSALHGKYVLVDFWASWCGPCRRENPNVVAAYNQFKE